MLTLYYSKTSSALAAHILLEETGIPYRTKEISISAGAHKSDAFLRLNPKGRLPTLETPEGILTENPAILEHIAATVPDKDLRPSGPFSQSKARALAAYLCATVHVAFAHTKRGARWSDDSAVIDAMKVKAPQNLTRYAHYLDTEISDGPWALGATYSYCDPYLFLMEGWLRGVDVDIADFPNLFAHNQAMRARPATQRILAMHDLSIT